MKYHHFWLNRNNTTALYHQKQKNTIMLVANVLLSFGHQVALQSIINTRIEHMLWYIEIPKGWFFLLRLKILNKYCVV